MFDALFARSRLRHAALAAAAAMMAACGSAEEGSGGRAVEASTAQRPAATPAGATLVTVYKSPTCGCCTKWVEHLQQSGFAVEVHDTADVQPVKARYGLPGNLASCHTALVGGYVVEGHVPADVIRRLLRERPQVAGVAIPGMPMGSPGMEGPYKDDYDVVSFTRGGATEVYESR